MSLPPIWAKKIVPNPHDEDDTSITIAYNVAAATSEVLALQKSMEPKDAKNVIGEIEGWPEEWGDGPFDGDCPLLIRRWVTMEGVQQAIGEFYAGPLLKTARKHSMKPTAPGAGS